LDSTLQGLLLTDAHILMRFEMYHAYPFFLWKLTRKWNKWGYLLAIGEFLSWRAEQLDTELSLDLRRDALVHQTMAESREHLQSETIQCELVECLEVASATSLDVERKHNFDKANEKIKVLHQVHITIIHSLRIFNLQGPQGRLWPGSHTKRKNVSTSARPGC